MQLLERRGLVATAQWQHLMVFNKYGVLLVIEEKLMKKKLLTIVLIFQLAGCVTAGHGGKISRTGGLEASCAGGCSEYKSDGSGCAKFHEDTSKSCAAYFETLCKNNREQCID